MYLGVCLHEAFSCASQRWAVYYNIRSLSASLSLRLLLLHRPGLGGFAVYTLLLLLFPFRSVRHGLSRSLLLLSSPCAFGRKVDFFHSRVRSSSRLPRQPSRCHYSPAFDYADKSGKRPLAPFGRGVCAVHPHANLKRTIYRLNILAEISCTFAGPVGSVNDMKVNKSGPGTRHEKCFKQRSIFCFAATNWLTLFDSQQAKQPNSIKVQKHRFS